jgi:hypothetical protein
MRLDYLFLWKPLTSDFTPRLAFAYGRDVVGTDGDARCTHLHGAECQVKENSKDDESQESHDT